MGVTIDASLNKLQEMYNIMEYEIGLIKEPDEKAWNREFINSLETAIDTMHKYQKIQEVMDNRPDDDAKSNSKALGKIEVIIYGNDD